MAAGLKRRVRDEGIDVFGGGSGRAAAAKFSKYAVFHHFGRAALESCVGRGKAGPTLFSPLPHRHLPRDQTEKLAKGDQGKACICPRPKTCPTTAAFRIRRRCERYPERFGAVRRKTI
jgi:hypothetical protein